MSSLGRTALCTLAALALIASSASAASLYTGPGSRPGPDTLYAPTPPAPPQLQNTGVWRAQPILVSGATSYRDGEFVYQDFLYDDHGARGRDPNDARFPGNVFSQPNGTYTYPTGAAYANNAADFVELRVKPLAGATAFRVTLNTMKDPSLVAFSIAIGGTAGVPLPFPHAAGASAPADLFLTVHPGGNGMVAELENAVTHAAVGPPSTVGGRGAPAGRGAGAARRLEPRRRRGAPGGGRGAVERRHGNYLQPLSPTATADQPGGGAPGSAAFFNVAFRNDEPMPLVSDVFNAARSPAWWRDKAQGEALATGDISPFHADVDFGKLAAGTRDDGGVPQTGPIDRILVSRYDFGQGADWTEMCLTNARVCKAKTKGPLQPYAIYVPKKPMPSAGYGMTLLMHSLSTNYNQYMSSRNQSQFGERGPGSIVITPEARDPMAPTSARRGPTCSRSGPTWRAATSSTRPGP